MASLRSLFLRSQQTLRPTILSSSHIAATATTVHFQPSARLSTSPSTSATPTTTQPQKRTQPPLVPQPTPFVPDVETFLTVIGRGLKQHAAKFPTWESLFSLSSQQMRDLGLEPPRSRKYLLRWRQRFRLGMYGIGGDLQHVQDGQAELRVLEIERATPSTSTSTSEEEGAPSVPALPKKMRFVVNVPPGTRVEDVVGTAKAAEQMSRVRGYKVEGLKTIVGPYAIPLKGQAGAKITVTEGMWEDKLGRKIDGGERRRTEVRYKKRIQERRQEREKAMSQK